MEKEEVNKIFELKDEINKVSDELIKKAQEIDRDVMTTRNDPEIKKIWNKLCRLHMKTMVACEYDAMDNKELAKVCGELSQPQACIEVLHLSEEETCCGRFLRRIREEE
jgi:lipid II:glycine glycyltransferase (peptidoglycan interpeptide bridge formation enzyme)